MKHSDFVYFGLKLWLNMLLLISIIRVILVGSVVWNVVLQLVTYMELFPNKKAKNLEVERKRTRLKHVQRKLIHIDQRWFIAITAPEMRDKDNVFTTPHQKPRYGPQQSTIWMRRQQAVCVRRAYKQYGEKKNPNVILDSLNMTVPKGSIYGLLGASGCGKTTLLSCIVGRRRLNAGEIWVLGGKPGSEGSGVPGPRVGYMPQEVALNKGFTIREAMVYFGWINGMTTAEVNEKVDFLVNFLQLPSADRLIVNLSGGQQRRVSLACVLVHDPELIILDEPTVGVDPVLRQNIWDHLVKIAKDNKTTVIITTHYIDETRQANLIGLMRGGRLLAEESPDNLLQKYASESLEEVFLKLSVIQNRGKRRRSSILQDVTASISVPEFVPDAVNMSTTTMDNNSQISGEFGEIIGPPSFSKRLSTSTEQGTPSDLPPDDDRKLTLAEKLKPCQWNHLKALIWKNTLWMWRNAPIMAFIMGLPIFQIILFCLSIGKDPVGLHLAIVNNEPMNETSKCPEPVTTCDAELISCKYLYYLSSKKQKLDYYKTVEEAKRAVKKGKAWAAVEFQSNFSAALKDRFESGKDADEESVAMSEINVWMDSSNQQIQALLQRDFLTSLQDFTSDIAAPCNISSNLLKLPMKFNPPVYGDQVPNFTDFAAPGVILTIIFFLAVALTSGAMLTERNEGILERSLVSGITGTEILMSHVSCQFVIMLFQSVMLMAFSFLVFNVTINGHFLTVFVLTVLTGLCGMSYGFVVSCITDTERNATYVAMGSFLPMVMVCGIIWPVEGMHPVLKPLSVFMPLTYSTESLRSIMIRGWSFTNSVVYFGFLTTVAWIILFLSASVLLIKFKKG